MGASTFFCRAKGLTAREAFRAALIEARLEEGKGGYSGTIIEKSSYVMIVPPEGVDPLVHAENLIEAQDPRIDDKWGPAGCIQLTEGTPEDFRRTYMFFGWASS